MSNWFHHVQFEALINRVKKYSGDNCVGYFGPMSRVKIDGDDFINRQDPALRLFMKVIGVSLDDNWASLYHLDTKMNSWLAERMLGPSAYPSEKLDELFDLRSSGEGWTELDRVLNYMAGVTLSEVVDSTRILHNADDPGLHGNVCYSVIIHFYRDNGGFSSLRWQALASSPERIAPLGLQLLQEKLAEFDRLNALGDQHHDFIAANDFGLGEPIEIDFRRNGGRQLRIPLIDGAGSERVVLSWRDMDIDVNEVSMMKALIAVAPEDARYLVKGRFLQGQLGL